MSLAQNETVQYLGQQRMEEALKDVNTIEDLLNDKVKLKNYYEAVNEYYQDKISKGRFNIIIKQMAKMNQENPELGSRLLNLQNTLRPYEIVSDMKTYALVLDRKKWAAEQKKYFGAKEDSEADLKTEIAELKQISKRITEFEKSIISFSKKEAGISKGQFYSKIKSDHKETFKNIVASVYFNDAGIVDLVGTKDPDLILYAIENLMPDRLRKLNLPENTLSLILSSNPKISDLTQSGSFERTQYRTQHGTLAVVEPLKATTYKFMAYKRPLHAVWRGIWISECVGGGTDRITPRRWATVILNQVNNYAVEKNGRFVGFIQELGMKKKNHHATYYATEFGVPDFKGDIIKIDPATLMPTKVSLLTEWFNVAPKNIVRVKSESSAINNAGVISTLRDSEKWNFKMNKGNAENFELADQKFADGIISSSVKNNFEPTYSYGDGIISDSTVPDAGNIKTLVSVKWSPTTLKKYLLSANVDATSFSETIKSNNVIFEKINQTELYSELFLKMRNSRPHDFLVLLAESNLPSKTQKKYAKEILNQKTNSAIEQIKIMNSLEDSNIEDFVRSIPLNLKNVEEIFNERLKQQIDLQTEIKILNQRILVENKSDLYPVVSENFDTFEFYGYHERDQLQSEFVKRLLSANPEILAKCLPGFAKHMREYEDKSKLLLIQAFKRDGLITLLRNLITATNPTLSSYYFQKLDQITETLVLDAVRNKDANYLKQFFKENFDLKHVKADNSKIIQSIISEIIKSKNIELYETLNNKFIQRYAKQIEKSANSLIPEVRIWLQLALKNENKGLVSVHDLLKTYQSHLDGHLVIAETPKPSSELSQNAAITVNPKILKLDKLIQKLFQSTSPSAVGDIQFKIDNFFKNEGLISGRTVEAIKSFLNAVTSENISVRKYQILAIFELAAAHDIIDFEVFEKARELSRTILSQPEFIQHRNVYAPVMNSRSAPVRCEVMFE